jgi:hypothetical protein
MTNTNQISWAKNLILVYDQDCLILKWTGTICSYKVGNVLINRVFHFLSCTSILLFCFYKLKLYFCLSLMAHRSFQKLQQAYGSFAKKKHVSKGLEMRVQPF